MKVRNNNMHSTDTVPTAQQHYYGLAIRWIAWDQTNDKRTEGPNLHQTISKQVRNSGIPIIIHVQRVLTCNGLRASTSCSQVDWCNCTTNTIRTNQHRAMNTTTRWIENITRKAVRQLATKLTLNEDAKLNSKWNLTFPIQISYNWYLATILRTLWSGMQANPLCDASNKPLVLWNTSFCQIFPHYSRLYSPEIDIHSKYRLNKMKEIQEPKTAQKPLIHEPLAQRQHNKVHNR